MVAKQLIAGLIMTFFAGGAFAEQETMTGFLIPSLCQPKEGTKAEPESSTDAWPAPHTTACALREACIKSGYGIWVENKFYRFGKNGQELALAYFQTTPRTSYHKVAVTGDFSNPKEVKVKFIRMVD